MGGSYRQCGACGKRALSIATRCPGCGRELSEPEVPEHGGVQDWTRFLAPAGVAAVLAVVAVLALGRLGRTSHPREEQSAFAAADSIAATEVAAAPVGGAGELRVARSWTNVRKSRSVKAPLEAMLMPGDTVLADSLGRGWYRVALEGEVLGYAYHSALAAVGEGVERSVGREGRPGI